MKTLILTEPDDVHAIFTKLALESLNQDCDLWFTADMPTKQTNSIHIDSEEFSWITETTEDKTKKKIGDKFDVVWWRRPRAPFIPAEFHENDLDCIIKENRAIYQALPLVVAESAWWINPYDSVKYAHSKIYQLKLAVECGFKVPSTLISNSPEEIKAFINPQQSVIYKPFCPHNWYENDELKFSYTKNVDLNQLPSDNMLQITPGIFQQQINKKYELRVTCFGEHMVAVKIDSQKHPMGITDWRVAPTQELILEPYQLLPSTQALIKTYMRKMGIVFGCFDFIVSTEGELYFLEVNEQGQFLWIEENLPEIRMLDMFVRFLINKSSGFKWYLTSNSLKLTDYDCYATQLINENITKHVYLNEIKQAVSV